MLGNGSTRAVPGSRNAPCVLFSSKIVSSKQASTSGRASGVKGF